MRSVSDRFRYFILERVQAGSSLALLIGIWLADYLAALSAAYQLLAARFTRQDDESHTRADAVTSCECKFVTSLRESRSPGLSRTSQELSGLNHFWSPLGLYNPDPAYASGFLRPLFARTNRTPRNIFTEISRNYQ